MEEDSFAADEIHYLYIKIALLTLNCCFSLQKRVLMTLLSRIPFCIGYNIISKQNQNEKSTIIIYLDLSN
ncbi:MAG: hypothetical protein ACI9FN_004082 [Saprospiraceae bacterium]|jgi:hypothetical protein